MNELSRKNYDACTNYMIGRNSKTQFYRLKRGDLPLSPREQREIVETLRSYGYEEMCIRDSLSALSTLAAPPESTTEKV